MKKSILLAAGLAALAASAFLVFQNLPMKRHARHIIKARLLAQEGNLAEAQAEYKTAFDIRGEYTPYVTLEVLQLQNRISFQQKKPEQALADTKIFVERHPTNKDGKLILAELALQAKEAGTAFDAIASVLKDDPANTAARFILARIRNAQGRFDLAEEQLRYLHEAQPDSLSALVALAENLVTQGKIPESRILLKKALGKNPKSGAAYLLLVDGYLKERNSDSAMEALNAWSGADSALAMPIALRRANLYSLTGNLDSAMEALRPFIEKAEKTEANLPALSEWAILHAKRGRYDSAILIYHAMEGIRPASKGEFLVLKTYLHLKALNPAQALEGVKLLRIGEQAGELTSLLPLLFAAQIAMGQEGKVREALAAQPDSLRGALQDFLDQLLPDKEFIGQWALVNYFQRTGQLYYVNAASKEFHDKWPQSPMAAAVYAANLASVGQYEAAARILSTLKKPSEQQNMALLSLEVRSGHGEKARVLAEKLLRDNPRQKGINLFLADYYYTHENKTKGLEYYEKELALDSNNAVALNNLAWEYGISQRSLEKAEPYLNRLRARKAIDPRILDTVGWILARNGSKEGLGYLRQAVQLVPDQGAYLYHLAWALAQAGDKGGAKTHLQNALATKAAFEERAEAEALLAQL